MTQEEKAKRYDEALERAKNTIEVNQTIPDIVECVESLFPELKESEDEKIRKALIRYFTLSDEHAYNEACGVSYRDIVAWLEKQAEQKSTEWSEEDKSRIITICTYLQDYARLSGSKLRTIRINEYCNWLKSLKERVQTKQEWSEEDEKFVHGLIRGLSAKRDIHGHTTFSSDCIDITETINWLKSLKDRYTWKPSDKQMKTLKYACGGNYVNLGILDSLYQDLQKLREEQL